MGWNGSGQKGAAPAQPKATTKKPSPVRGLVAGVVVVALAVVAYFAFFSGSEKPQKVVEQKKPAAIKTVTPAAAPVQEQQKPKKHDANWRPSKKPNKTAGVERPKLESKDVIDYGLITSTEFFGRKLFKSWTDNYLAGFLQMTPGDVIIDTSISERFDEDFKKALNDKIEILPEDTEDDIAVKNAVIAAKERMKECLAKGESPREILQSANEDMRKICDYREQLERNVSLLLKNNGTKADVLDYVKESNEMLKEYGARPITLPPFALHKLEKRELESQAKGTMEQ